MASAVKFAVSNWHRQTRVLNFIYLQLVQLTTDIDKAVQNGMVSLQYMSKITHQLDIVENNSLQACNPPLEQSTMKKFETIRDLGKGSFGTVSLVRLKDTDKTFARKTIMDDSISNVQLERDILTFNNHPFVISMLCSVETKTSMCFLMEYAEGGDCETQLKRLGRFHSNRTHKFAAQIVLALEYIHSYGILHRDIKPANLLLTSNVTIKLADFGLCKIGPVNMTVDRTRVDIEEIVREFTDKERTGTITHMPPEVIQKQGYGKPVDWWALGITLYQFLTGLYPFRGHTKEDTMNEVVHMELIWPEGFFPERDEKDFITRLLEKDPRKRLGTFGASEVKAHPYLKFVDWNKVLNLYDTSEPYNKPYTTVSAKRRIQRLLQEYKAQTAASWEF